MSAGFARVRTPDRYPGWVPRWALSTYRVPSVRQDRLDDPHWSSTDPGARRPR